MLERELVWLKQQISDENRYPKSQSNKVTRQFFCIVELRCGQNMVHGLWSCTAQRGSL